ncbi:AAA ATPase-like protein [Actinoplanes lutulentus]|uniref:AAA ATPase-like protein n=2 Tax=Actinoplanes lutulentus TaxID=1287878 RepID=A0A327ZL50_9ACTN|nr:AAA ATPase-like protein [Actinoplanes lutulentus]
MLAGVRGGTASAVVLRGGAGAGKSTLIEALEREAERIGFQTLVCVGVQSEASIGMAGLHQLLHAAISRVDGLPPQQRDALRSAFGIGPDVAPDRLLLSVAVLSLLEDIATDRPLLLVLEDVHWMDDLTVGMMSFVARRLGDTPILMVASCRSDEPNPLDALRLPEVTLGRMSEAEATLLLTEINPALGPEARLRVLDEAEGNPLALVELARGLADRGLTGSAALPSRLPLGERIERAFAARVTRLPQPTQDLLLIAAANSEPWLHELAAAAGERGSSLDALAAAEQAGLVQAVGDELRFRHPLIRSAVYATATPPQRVSAHEALAAILTDEADQPRAAAQRAAAVTGTDERVAADLDQAAVTLMARGSTASAMRSWERAADLSPAADRRALRLALAAEAARRAGLNTAALRLAAAATRASTDPLIAARAGLTENVLALTTGVITRDPLELGSIARRAGRTPENVAASLGLLMNTAILCAAHAAGPDVRSRLEEDLRSVPAAAGTVHAAVVRALLDPARHGQAAVEALRTAPAPASPLDALSLGLGAEPAHEWILAAGFHRSATARAREEGSVGDLATAAVTLGRALAIQGRLGEALTAAEEGRRLAEDLDEPLLVALADVVIGQVHAWRGSSSPASPAGLSGLSGRMDIVVWQRWNAGLADLAAGRHWNAYVQLVGVCDVEGLGLFAIADLAEAASRGGNAEQFGERLAEAQEYARSWESPLIRMLLLRAQALTAEDSEPLFTAALAFEGYPLQTARTRLAYGEWLRRQRRIGEARTQLTAAAAAFQEAGAQPWAERASAELGASGVAVASVSSAGDTRKVLTTQELQIARLAATGMSNKEIADQLFLSHRTVGTHLYRIYAKLGISGRGTLRDAITDLP